MELFIPPLASAWHYVFGTLMFLTSLFLILLVLVQRGRGGGLAGAFGGMGGQSAFGTKAGDLFTRLTMGVATFWILLCMLAIAVLNRQDSVFGDSAIDGPSVFESTDEDSSSAPAPSTTDPTAPLDFPAAEDRPADSAAETAQPTEGVSASDESPETDR